MAESRTSMAGPRAWTAVALLAVLGLLAGLAASIYFSSRPQEGPDPRPEALLWPSPKTVAAFELGDQHGQPFDPGRLYGRWSFMFFGYTHCPDVCPLTLAFFDRLAARLEREAAELPTQYVFVSVDPQRDGAQRLAEYIAHFDPRIVGVTGRDKQIQSLTSQLGVVAQRVKGDDPEDYLVDHSAAILLLDPRARLVGIFSLPHRLDEVTEQFLAIVRFLETQA